LTNLSEHKPEEWLTRIGYDIEIDVSLPLTRTDT